MTSPLGIDLRSSEDIETLIRALKLRDQLASAWKLRPATVSFVRSSSILIILDGDSEPVRAFSLIGDVRLNDRVMILEIAGSGNFLLGTIGPTPAAPVVSLTRTTTQSMPNAPVQGTAAAYITWTSVVNDPFNWFTPSDDIFTIPAEYAGVWHFKVYARFTTSSAGIRVAQFEEDETTLLPEEARQVSNAVTPVVVSTDCTRVLEAGQTMRVFLFQSSGGALNIEGSGVGAPMFHARYLGKAGT